MRRLLPLLAVAALTACGSSSSKPVDLTSAGRPSSARFAISIKANVAGVAVQTEENGTVSFTKRVAHVYKLTAGTGETTPLELIYDGDVVYSNANVLLALADPSVKPWIKQERNPKHVDDVDHVRALASLASAAVAPERVGKDHYRARVEPARLRPAVARVVRTDYLPRPFPADFWLDRNGRVERVRVAYRTDGGGSITVVGTFSDFGTKVDVTPPVPSDVETVRRATG